MLRLQLQPVLAVHTEQGAALLQLPGLLAALEQGPWRRFPPDAAALETAIALVEDALMPQLPALAGDASGVICGDQPPLQQLASLDGEPSGWPVWLSTGDVERLFARLASAAGGVPLPHAGLPDDPPLCALLLVVRELMHHAGLEGIRIDKAASHA